MSKNESKIYDSFTLEEGIYSNFFAICHPNSSDSYFDVNLFNYLDKTILLHKVIWIVNSLKQVSELEKILSFQFIDRVLVLEKTEKEYEKCHSLPVSHQQDLENYLNNLDPYLPHTFLFEHTLYEQFPFLKIWNRKHTGLPQAIISLNTLANNFLFFKKSLAPKTQIIAVIKGVGSIIGIAHLAKVLTREGVDYFGVARTHEGILLRRAGIKTNILVFNPVELQLCLDFHLEPEIYSLSLLKTLLNTHFKQPLWVHIKIDTGMHRLGISQNEIEELVVLLKKNSNKVKVKSIMTHFACANDGKDDNYSKWQADSFKKSCIFIQENIGYSCFIHASNTAGTLRFADYHFDMVRVGIGLYGIDPTDEQKYRNKLKNTITLEAEVLQVKHIKKNTSIGYNRKYVAKQDMKIAIVGIGYSDEIRRAFSNGVGGFVIKGVYAPIVGNICMDMTMVDVSLLPDVKRGDIAMVTGDGITPYDRASQLNTIAYETIAPIGHRTKRMYVF